MIKEDHSCETCRYWLPEEGPENPGCCEHPVGYGDPMDRGDGPRPEYENNECANCVNWMSKEWPKR